MFISQMPDSNRFYLGTIRWEKKKDSIKNVVWCGDGDSLGKHGKELRASTAARFEGRWREHEYSGEKDFPTAQR